MNEATVILGSDLIRHQGHVDFADGFADLLDPNGINIVVMEMIHEDMFVNMRVEMLFKLKEREEPIEGSFTMPYVIYKQIAHRMTVGANNVN